MQKQKHICFISAGLAGGGMERSLTHLANFAAEKGYQVTILNLFRTEVFFDIHPDITIIWPEIDRSSMHRMMYAIRLLPYIRKQLQTIKPSTVLSFGEWFNSYVLLATRGLNLPVYISDRMGPLMNLGWLLESARRLTYSWADGIIAQTQTASDIIKTKTKTKNITVIPNGVLTKNHTTSVRKNQIVSVGRLSREKGHIYLIRAFAKIKSVDQWTLHLIGDGREMDNLINEAKALGLLDRVVFYGYLKDFDNILAASKIFVLPSLYEGFPNALLEAMDAGLACISSDCVAGPSDIIEQMVNGILVKPEDVEGLAEQLNFLIAHQSVIVQFGNKGMEVKEAFSMDKTMQAYLDFINPNICL